MLTAAQYCYWLKSMYTGSSHNAIFGTWKKSHKVNFAHKFKNVQFGFNVTFLFLDFTWHCSTAAAGLVTLDFIFNTAFYAVKWVFSPQLHFPHSSIFLTAEGNRTCKFDQILWPMLSSTKISCLTGVLNPGLLSVKPRLYHWAKLPLLKMRGKTVKYILHKYILGYFGNQQKATDQINSRLNKQQKTTDFKKQQISKTTDFKNSRFQKTDFKNNS